MNREDITNPLELIESGRTPGERLFLLWDLAMVVLVLLNLALIAFDMLFAIDALAAAFETIAPLAHAWYLHNIHENFLAIDLVFVAIFVFDVVLGWTIAVVEKQYLRWYFYPFAHWYDVLGCIPVAGFRLLRILRVISITIRLQRLGLIEIRDWAIYRKVMVVYDIIVEEVSDRVVVNVLSGAQREIASGGSELTDRVLQEIVQPRQQQLVRAASTRIEDAVIKAWQENRPEIRRYIGTLVHAAVHGNRALHNLERVPMLGSTVTHALDEAITDTVHEVLNEAVTGLESSDFDNLVQHITDTVLSQLLEQGAGEPTEFSEAVVEVLDLVKEQVAVKQWRGHFK